MPHIALNMYPGRTEERKKELAEKMRDFLAEEMGMDKRHFTVTVKDIPAEHWDEELAKVPEEEIFVKGE